MNTISNIPHIDLQGGLLESAASRLRDQQGTLPGGRDADLLLGNEMESMFASLLIKSMRETLTEDGLFPGDNADALGSLFDQYMGQQIADAQGLGLARSLTQPQQAVAAYRAGSQHD
jgi:Rod binding domain-containing protein